MAVWCKKLGYYVIYGITNYNFVWGVCVCLSQSLALRNVFGSAPQKCLAN